MAANAKLSNVKFTKKISMFSKLFFKSFKKVGIGKHDRVQPDILGVIQILEWRPFVKAQAEEIGAEFHWSSLGGLSRLRLFQELKHPF